MTHAVRLSTRLAAPCLAALLIGCDAPAPPPSAPAPAALVSEQADMLPFVEDFERREDGSEYVEGLVLDGEFRVRAGGEGYVLELAGEPLGECGVLLGPATAGAVKVSARVRGESKGRQAPDIAIGIGEASGYRLRVRGATGKLEIVRGEEVLAAAPLKFPTGEWITLRLATEPTGEAWKLRGNAGEVAVEAIIGEEPPAGRASIWGVAYSGKAILFDDVRVER